jgi:hypothetical protein
VAFCGIAPAAAEAAVIGSNPVQEPMRGAVVIEVEQVTEIAEALGLRRPGAAKRKSKRRNGHSCEDCFFHRRMLCALDLDEPCSTFRPDTPHGLVPPRQPALLVRET